MTTLDVERFSGVLVCFTICLFENDDFVRRTFQWYVSVRFAICMFHYLYVSLFVCLKMMTLDVERFSDVSVCFTICLFENDDCA